MAKEINVIVTYNGRVPDNVNMDDLQEQIENRFDSCFRLNFPTEGEEEYDEDLNDPFFDINNVIVSEDGYTITT